MDGTATYQAAPLPPIPTGLIGSWVDGWEALWTGLADCTATVLRTGRPLDVPRWLATMADRREPTWSSPHEIVFETPHARLRDFSTGTRAARVVPTLVLPPQAGHDSCIVDYSPRQSQMGAILEAGLTRAFSLDWLQATPATKDVSVQDYLDIVDRAVEHCGGRVNLIGDCQGGWLAAIYAALSPERVNTLTIGGAPIDFRAGSAVICEVVDQLAPGGDLRFYEALVAAGGGLLRGDHMLSGFVLIRPRDEVSRQLALLCHLDDPAHVERYREFEDWYKHMRNIGGAFYLWIVRHLFCDNELVRGRLDVGGRRVDLGRIDMPLNLLAGESDHITPPAQVLALADHVSTPADAIERTITRGGHLGLFMSRESLREAWPPLLERVRALSAPSSPRPSSPARR